MSRTGSTANRTGPDAGAALARVESLPTLSATQTTRPRTSGMGALPGYGNSAYRMPANAAPQQRWPLTSDAGAALPSSGSLGGGRLGSAGRPPPGAGAYGGGYGPATNAPGGFANRPAKRQPPLGLHGLVGPPDAAAPWSARGAAPGALGLSLGSGRGKAASAPPTPTNPTASATFPSDAPIPKSAPPPPAAPPRRQFAVSAAAATIKGSHPAKTANQDMFLIEVADAATGASSPSASTRPQAVVGVFDGHGELGHRVSAFITDRLRGELLGMSEGARAGAETGAPAGEAGASHALLGAFERTDRALHAASGIDIRHSGSTACTAQLAGDELLVANVGDSRAVLGRWEAGADAIVAIDLSQDHKPDSEGEYRRITRVGGRVAPMHVPGHGFVGPARVWDRSQRFGLATSRAFGDSSHSVASGGQVIAVPEVTLRKLGDTDRLVILGTDGIWDQLTSQEAVTLAARYGADTQAASDTIAREAKRRWELSGPIRDDITVVVMRIEPAVKLEPSGATALLRRGRDSLMAQTH
jgi:serine/threonine protein phosphatase PrpC